MNTMPNWIDKRAYLSPGKEAFVLPDGTTYTFKELQTHVKSYAEHLKAHGIKSGDHIAILSTNCYEMAVLIHALNDIQAVTFLLNTRLTQEEIAFQLNDGQVKALIHHDIYKETASCFNESVLTYNLHTFPKNLKSDLEINEVSLGQTSHIIYTSGTTGRPKGVQLTYGNHFWSATASALNLGLHETDRWLMCVPMFHVSGLSILYRSIIYGIPIHMHEQFDAESVHEDLMNNGITMISVVSLMLEQLMEKLGPDHYPEVFRCMLLGGGPAPKYLLERCQDKSIPVFQTYGMTETASQFCTLDKENMLSKIGSAGKPLFPGQLKIVENGRECSEHEIGEIIVKGPSVTKGYWNREKANHETINNGWLKTGDLGYLDEDGFLFVVDRRKDLIISGGENIYPAEIESVLKGMDAVLDAGVVGKGDSKWGQVPVAFIVKKKEVTEEEIIKYATQKLAKYKVPKQVYFVNELPRNASKKLQRHKLFSLVHGEDSNDSY